MGTPNKGTIEKTKEIQNIKSKYGVKYFFNIQSHQEAAAVWGVPCNDHGVVMETKDEVVAKAGGCEATMRLAETPEGHWLMGLGMRSAYSGYGYAPSVWSETAFASYAEARHFAIGEFIGFFNEVATASDSCNSEQNKQNARKIVEKLQSGQTTQLTLFG